MLVLILNWRGLTKMNKSGQKESSESCLFFINNKLTKMIFDIRNFLLSIIFRILLSDLPVRLLVFRGRSVFKYLRDRSLVFSEILHEGRCQ